jgi:hypothetical protein
MRNFDILNINDVICQVIVTNTIICPSFVFCKEMDLSKINLEKIKNLFENTFEMTIFTYKCYSKYSENNNDIYLDPIHFRWYFWIKYILIMVFKNIKTKSNNLKIFHGCCEDNCKMISELTDIVLNEL